ncbi:MAG TPA: PKD domain-containing protein [Cyclobacteriaceae bacterium]|nr:PKD domain-containing protein [Cyclobacteriaceae bacterium]
MLARLVVLFSFVSLKCLAQDVPLIDFSIETTACKEQNVFIENLTKDGARYEWEFCAGNLSSIPTATSFYSTSSFQNVNYLTYYEEANNHYGFVVDRTNRKIYRLDFGSSIDNIPTIVDLGNLGQNFLQPIQLQLFKENEILYGLLIDFESSILYRITFGSTVTNTSPSVISLGTLSALNGPIGLAVLHDGVSVKALVSNFNSSKCSLIDFGASIGFTPTVSQIELGFGTTRYRGLTVINDQDNWFAFVCNDQNNMVRVLKFSGALNGSPTVTTINSIMGANSIQAQYDGGIRYAFVQSLNGDLYRLLFSNDWSQPPSVANLGKLGILSSASRGITIIRKNGQLSTGLIINSSSTIIKLDFSTDCQSSISFSTDETPPSYAYISSGTYTVTLTAYSSVNKSARLSKQILVGSNTSPDIGFDLENSCAHHDVNFTMLNNSGDVIDHTWDFGDANHSAIQNPTHQYDESGDYDVTLEVIASNGCKNLTQQTVSIYNEPLADFYVPNVSTFCTNQAYLFENTSIVDLRYPVAWRWFVNGIEQTNEEDFEFAFDQQTQQDITLAASIPGCENSMTKTISSLLEGPTVDFSSIGRCEDNEVIFADNSLGDVATYQWSFDDGGVSDLQDPVHIFLTPGVFNVTLQANSSNGCQNTKTKPITIYSKPQPNFQLELPPFSCSGMPSQFTDLTPSPVDSNISGWSWSFGDSGSGMNSSFSKNPTHIYDNARQYDVTLTAETNYGCVDSLKKMVTIAQTPIVQIENTPACDDVPVTFSASSSESLQSWNWQIGITHFSIPEPTYLFNNPGDYTVNLDAVGTNNCIASTAKNVIVPQTLVPDFAVQKNCINQSTEFTDATFVYDDPIAEHAWSFGDTGTGAGSPISHSYQSTGNYAVSLGITTSSGCSYTRTKTIAVGSPPVASFAASPEVGVPPFNVNFTNTSTGATSYLWNFNDENSSTSTEVSPEFTFLEYGNYVVDLTAYNALNCSHTVSKVITGALPLVNVGLENLVLSENTSGLLTGQVVIYNKGNFTVQNLKLLIDLSGIEIQQMVNQAIPAYSSILYALDFNIVDGGKLSYICVKADMAGDSDVSDNSICTSIDSEVVVTSPYPNPSNGNDLHVDWISPEEQPAVVDIYDALGRVVFENEVVAERGFNAALLNIGNLGQGVYFLVFSSGQTKHTFRFAINR